MIDALQIAVFARRLVAAQRRIDVEAVDWQEQWGGELVSSMSSLAPRDTGALAGSISYRTGTVEVGVRYGSFVEYGTSRTAPQPFTRPAITRIEDRAARDAGKRGVNAI